jgi:uncharacterized protein YgiM (DUF1202 family)/beta-lactamase class A
MQRIGLSFVLILMIAALVSLPLMLTEAQTLPEVYAQALGTANLRAGPGQEFDVVGEIAAGTDYRILQQHALVPWVLLEVPALNSRGGWVFRELIQITSGDLVTVPFTESFDPIPSTSLAITAPSAAPDSESPSAPQAPSDESATTVTPTLPAAVVPANIVTAILTGRSNIRYAPGVEYPPIAMFDAGTVLTILARHASFPWYQVVVEGSPTGTGWINEGVVEVTGDIFTLPVIEATTFDFPTPTATPQTVQVAGVPQGVLANDSPTLAQTLGQQIDNYLLSQNIAPRTDREASVFVMDLVTGEHFTLNGGVAYSGMSINKIPVLVSYFIQRDRPLETSDAELLASTMICSENTSTNRVMTAVGEGDILLGGERITQYMQQLGLGEIFVVAPFFTGDTNATPAPVSSVQTSADQQRTQPDLFNQMTVEEQGWLLASIYQCAANDEGLLRQQFPNQITQNECRQMVRVMSGNRIGRLIEAGVPDGMTIAHKHGWIENTHGDAGMVFGPQGAYVIAMVNHQRGDWLLQDESFPILEEISRLAWNHFNPAFPQEQAETTLVPETCNIYGETVIPDMLGGNIPIPTLPAPAATQAVLEVVSTEEAELTPTATP